MAEWNSQANDLFLRAAEVESPDERRLFLDQQCSDDAALRAQVESLLAASAKVGSFLSQPAARALAASQETVDHEPIAERPGTIIGPYKLLQQIGEGGFGVVYMAEQEKPVRRMVALKIIKPGMDTALVIARFEAERQALALMDHPNIARVLDAGTTEEKDEGGRMKDEQSKNSSDSSFILHPSSFRGGRPYFVMELVKGIPITEFCDQNHLLPEARLKLFVDVCHAVQHAHHKGVIHRDIKPSNVMVTLHDGVPVVKVIDFGVAKATWQKLTERTLFTAYGQMIGTPAYMSPEQAEMSGLDIDTRSDVYSLGVLLYELLTGTTPLESERLREAGYAEMQRLIREEEAPRPSTRLSSLGQTATVLAGNRGLDVKGLARLLAGDLDWIVMKALEKDRNRRYGTPENFAEDIKRYLRHEAILARPPSTAYKLKKFAQRNRGAVLTAAMVAAALVVGTALATWQAVAARQAEFRALAERDEKEQARKDADIARKKAEDFADEVRQANVLSGRASVDFHERRWASAHAKFARAEQLQPDSVALYYLRRIMHETLGLWDRYADDMQKIIALMGLGHWSSSDLYDHALLRMHVGDRKSYREACRTMLQRFGNDDHAPTILETVRACVLDPDPVTNPADLVRHAELVLRHQKAHWHLYVAGLAHYRAGQYERAVERLCQSLTVGPSWNSRAINYPVLAMAHHRLGHTKEARGALTSAEKAIDEWTTALLLSGRVDFKPIPWMDWLECLHYFREANLFLVGSPPPTDARLQLIRERALALLEPDGPARLLAERKVKLGPDHPATVGCACDEAENLMHLGRGIEAVALIDEYFRLGVRKNVSRRLFRKLIDLRVRHFEKRKDAAGCRQSVEMWEKAINRHRYVLYSAGCWRAVTAAVLRQTDPSPEAVRQADMDADRAVAWLKQAVQAGWNDTWQTARDRDLDILRDRADFKKLLADLEAGAAVSSKETKTAPKP
jgi:serine/threonine protein kinase